MPAAGRAGSLYQLSTGTTREIFFGSFFRCVLRQNDTSYTAKLTGKWIGSCLLGNNGTTFNPQCTALQADRQTHRRHCEAIAIVTMYDPLKRIKCDKSGLDFLSRRVCVQVGRDRVVQSGPMTATVTRVVTELLASMATDHTPAVADVDTQVS